jgi:hypothetical protein
MDVNWLPLLFPVPTSYERNCAASSVRQSFCDTVLVVLRSALFIESDTVDSIVHKQQSGLDVY